MSFVFYQQFVHAPSPRAGCLKHLLGILVLRLRLVLVFHGLRLVLILLLESTQMSNRGCYEDQRGAAHHVLLAGPVYFLAVPNRIVVTRIILRQATTYLLRLIWLLLRHRLGLHILLHKRQESITAQCLKNGRK